MVVLQVVYVVMGYTIFYCTYWYGIHGIWEEGWQKFIWENNLSSVWRHQSWVYRVHQQCWSAEERLLHQELNSRLRTRVKQGAPLHFDCANLYFNLPPTSLNYQNSWWSQALLHHLKLFWDTCARWFWWTERQAWILDHLHATVNNTSCVKLWKLKVSQPWGGGVWGAVCASFLPFPAALPGAR